MMRNLTCLVLVSVLPSLHPIQPSNDILLMLNITFGTVLLEVVQCVVNNGQTHGLETFPLPLPSEHQRRERLTPER